MGITKIPTLENTPVVIDDISNSRWSYAGSKALSEQLISTLNNENGFNKFNYCILRFNNIYGPFQRDHFIDEFTKRIMVGKFTLKGNQTRSFLYIDDAIQHTISISMNKEVKNEIVNIGSNKEISSLEVANEIMKLLNLKNKIKILKAPKGSVARRRPSIKKMKKYSSHVEKVKLKEGLKLTIEKLNISYT